jgi:phosphomevalonate kinase
MAWTVVCDPINDTLKSGVNRSALRVCLSDGTVKIECCRVGLIRRNTQNKDTEFIAQLQIELDKADECAVTLNALEEELERLRAEAAEKARVRIREVMGKPSPVPA